MNGIKGVEVTYRDGVTYIYKSAKGVTTMVDCRATAEVILEMGTRPTKDDQVALAVGYLHLLKQVQAMQSQPQQAAE